MLELLYEMQEIWRRSPGCTPCSLQPAAGAHGELTALLVAAAYFRDSGGEKRTKVLVPDSAHGTNPASAAMAGFDAVTVKSNADGSVDLDDLKRQARRPDRRVHDHQPEHARALRAARSREIADAGPRARRPVYLDGANMNAILGIARPGDFGADMMHYNPHKTFSGPHGGGGPGAGPICVTRTARAVSAGAASSCKDGDRYRLDYDRPKSIGRVRSFFGNVGVLVRGLLLHPHARPGRPAAASARTPCSTPTTCSAA